jgi:hypothetical protein
MSEEIIKVLDNICAKIGIAIDWSAENVWPYVMDVLGRYRIMELIGCSLWVAVCVSVIVAIVLLIKKSIKGFVNEKELWYDRGDPGPLTLIVWLGGGIISAVMVAILSSLIPDLLKWAVVPEIKYLDMLAKYI